MKKLLVGLACLLMLVTIGDVFAQGFNPVRTTALIVFEDATQNRYLRIANYDDYYKFTTSSSSDGIRFTDNKRRNWPH